MLRMHPALSPDRSTA